MVPWSKYSQFYNSVSTELGLEIVSARNFYYSIASSFENDNIGIFKSNNTKWALDVLLTESEFYPKDYNVSSWIIELYFRTNQIKNGKKFLNQTLDIIENNATLTEKEKADLINEVILMQDN